MKAPAFWYQPETQLARALAPLGNLYRLAATARRWTAKPYKARVPVICVGNVTAGGSGKTPTALALAALLQQQGHHPVFVTRGYGGTQHGPLRVEAAHHGAEDVGDEALLLLRQAPVWIGRDRAAAIRMAEQEATHIILDDGLQNPNIRPDLALLTIDGTAGIGNGYLIPAGPLREPLADALRRVQAVLVIGEQKFGTNGGASTPLAGGTEGGLSPQGQQREIGTSPPPTPPASGRGALTALTTKTVLRARFEPAIPNDFPRNAKFLAFAGIGRPQKFYDLCRREKLSLVATQDFADHHYFTVGELQLLAQKAAGLGARLLTTEKDWVRLPPMFRERVLSFPVNLKFDDTAAIEKLLQSTVAPSLPS